MNGDWRGLPGKVERFLTDSGCEEPNWVAGIVAAYGLSERYTKRAREIRKCDPMWSHSWFSESRAFLWAGDKEEALRVAREGLEIAPGGWLGTALVRALIANGLYEEADHAITTQFRLEEDILMANVMKTAAMGDQDAAAAIVDELKNIPNPTAFNESIYSAWVGDRENANHLAAKIDEHPFGSQSLLLLVYWCACGAPFDLEATPNFAARINAAGMPWPPASPITFPLKDW